LNFVSIDSAKVIKLKIGRFQVMAVLQAARAYALGMPLYLSKSWGLNRAIFYAAAKRGFKKMVAPPRPKIKVEVKEKPIVRVKNIQYLGDEAAYIKEVGNKIYFTIGGKPQTEEDFRRQIESKFGEKFETVWREALEIVKKFDKEILLSQRSFYEKVYKPLRDELTEKWSKL